MSAPGFAGRIADRLIDSKLVPLIVAGTLIAGIWGLVVTPREDRPEIEVPTARIVVPFPGAGVERVDELVARPVSAWVGQLEQVTEVRSVASSDAAMLEIEFSTGIKNVQAWSLLRELLDSNRADLPRDAGPAEIRTIGDELLTILMLTLSSAERDGAELRRIGDEMAVALEAVEGVRSVEVFGGQPRQIQVRPLPDLMAAHGIGLVKLAEAIEASSLRLPAEVLRADQDRQVRIGSVPASRKDIEQIQVGVGPAGVVYLGDVAEIFDGAAPMESASLHWQRGASREVAAVGLGLTSVPNSNVISVTRNATRRLDQLTETMLPSDVRVSIGHDSGRMAHETVVSVLENFAIATVTVIAIIFAGLGWRAAAGVTIQLPSSLAIVPLAYLALGFTLNPVSIAAMILAIGLLADDNVIIMENIRRHFREAGERSREVAVAAVDEVGNPTMLAVFLIIATFMPTAFITGEMGQYTRAIPVGTSLAIAFSLVIALTVTPWVAFRVLRAPKDAAQGKSENGDRPEKDKTSGRPMSDERSIPSSPLARGYRIVLRPFFDMPWLRWLLYAVLVLLLAGSVAMVFARAVQLTLVPFLDRDIFVVELELPPGSALEQTLNAASTVGRELRQHPDIDAYTVFAGTEGPLLVPPPGPPNLDIGKSHRARIYVQLPPREQRRYSSVEISRDFAFSRLPDLLQPFQARAWVRNIPSGPSSENDIQAEITGEDAAGRERLADAVARLLEEHPATGAVERFPKPTGPELQLEVDPIRAAARGVPPARVAAAVRMALAGRTVAELDVPEERGPLPVVVRLDPERRQRPEDLSGIYVEDETGGQVPLFDLVDLAAHRWDANRYRRNQVPIVYVAARVNRSLSQPVSVQRDLVAELERRMPDPPDIRWFGGAGSGQNTTLYWGGEWELTQRVYRDLGVAGMVVVLAIYIVLAGWFGSYILPLLIMAPIPLVFIGVIPGHWLMGLDIAGLGVLGMIALAGIVVRNALLLVDFTERRVHHGMEIRDALVSAGVVRTRPILLTAGTVLFGSGALVFEPALKPLGITLATGVLVATILTLILIPVLYFHAFHERDADDGG
ncbi:MAG TPA: efflux RND transporter permease subunit [Wenzhouxiangellaceae bacterium]|nr:efflux RND transporter permease subunit [Wenzhouxiangellaceae bacterium]